MFFFKLDKTLNFVLFLNFNDNHNMIYGSKCNKIVNVELKKMIKSGK